MSSQWVCAQELGHAVPFVSTAASALLKRLAESEKLASVTPATQLTVRPVPEMVASGIVEFDALTGGLPRGCLSEIFGPASSGRTSVLLAALAEATQRQEVCALVDTNDAFDPVSAAAAGVDFGRLLWVRCGKNPPRSHGVTEKKINKEKSIDERLDPLAQALRVTDLLLQSGGFGMVAVDLGDVPMRAVRRIPLTSWFRFQRAVENTPTVLLAVAEIPCAPACAALLVKLQSEKQLSAFSSQLSAADNTLPAHAVLFGGLHVQGEIVRSRMEKKPVRSASTRFATRAVG